MIVPVSRTGLLAGLPLPSLPSLGLLLPCLLSLGLLSPGLVGQPSGEASGAEPLAALRQYLTLPLAERPDLTTLPVAGQPLSRQQAETAGRLLWEAHAAQIRRDRAEEMRRGEITLGELSMRFFYKRFGDKPEGGRSLYISMHGGGGAPARVNDSQWENQKRLYTPTEGIYLVPRAPTNTWNLWHQAHIDPMFTRLIENMLVFEDVDPDRVYLLGYSAGGDGVFQLAPRMADQLAAAAMMAGHPNETSPLGLRNLPFAIYMGGRDAAYNRNQIAAQWQERLAALREADPDGYPHRVRIYPDKGHWMDRQDAEALPWMAQQRRRTFPKRIVWKQDDVQHARFYWLAVDPDQHPSRAQIDASLDGQTIELDAPGGREVRLRLNDQMLDLDRPVVVRSHGQTLFSGQLERTVRILHATLAERGDPRGIYSAEIAVTVPPTAAKEPAQEKSDAGQRGE